MATKIQNCEFPTEEINDKTEEKWIILCKKDTVAEIEGKYYCMKHAKQIVLENFDLGKSLSGIIKEN